MKAKLVTGEPRRHVALVSSTLWVTGATLLLAALFMTVIDFRSEKDDLLSRLRAQARIVAENASAPLLFNDSEAALAALEPLKMDRAMRAAELADQDSRVAQISMAGSGHDTGQDSFVSRLGVAYSVSLTEPVMLNGRQIGKVTLQASMVSVYNRAYRSLATYILILSVTLLMAYFVLRKQQREISEVELRLEQQAHFDSVTGLPNRNAFNDMLGHTAARYRREAGSFALLYLDLDNFKLVNDTMGHAAGDRLLALVGERLRSVLREVDSVYRLGGDEFTVIADQCPDGPAAAMLAGKLIRSLEPVFDVFDEVVHVSASFGISLYPADTTDIETLVRNADTAMYHAKASGKNNFQFFSGFMEERARHRMGIEKAMRRAFEANEFVLHYQPMIDLKSGQLTGCEALLRWNNATLGQVPPSDFIPVAEETGFIVPLGAHVLLEACRQIKTWNSQGYGSMRVSANISGRQLYEANFTRQIRDILRETGIEPGWLELEITESMLMNNLDQAVQKLHELRGLGVSLAIDDFGTGYSSMSYLKRLPVSKLKIDRSFVRDIVMDKDDAAITSAIIALGHSLNMQVVAEGVELAAQVEMLRGLGCDLAQGYHFGRPVAASQVAVSMAGTIAISRS